LVWLAGVAAALVVLHLALASQAQQARRPVIVKIEDEQAKVEEISLPVDPQIRAQPGYVGMGYGLNVEGKRLTFGGGSARSSFKIDGQVISPGAQARPLGAGPRGKQRHGVIATAVHNGVHLTQIMEIVPGKPSAKPKPGEKRRMDTLLIRYIVENKDTRPHAVGVRMHIDTYCWTNDGCLFASPEKAPGRVLDGVEFKGKDVPEYVQILQNNNLQNPGWIAHFTFRIGGKLEPPSRVILTSLAANNDGWDVQVMQAGGDSAVAFFWDPQMLAPGSKREMAYAHGQGIATNPENEGKVSVVLGGSFEPDKLFSIMAYVNDPVEAQSLTLELPPGMERVEGREIQPVPPASGENTSIVSWRARVLRTGTFPLRIRSSNGVTYTKLVTITAAGQ